MNRISVYAILVIFFAFPKTAFAENPLPLTIEVLIDGGDEIHFKSTGFFFVHRGKASLPGKWNGADEPVYISGKSWTPPQWKRNKNKTQSTPLYLMELNTATLEANLIRAGKRGEEGIAPEATIKTSRDGEKFIVQIPDKAPGGRWYTICISAKKENPKAKENSKPSSRKTIDTKRRELTLGDFNSIRVGEGDYGMTCDQIVELLGFEGETLSENADSYTVKWSNKNGGYIRVSFDSVLNDAFRASRKQQRGLTNSIKNKSDKSTASRENGARPNKKKVDAKTLYSVWKDFDKAKTTLGHQTADNEFHDLFDNAPIEITGKVSDISLAKKGGTYAISAQYENKRVCVRMTIYTNDKTAEGLKKNSKIKLSGNISKAKYAKSQFYIDECALTIVDAEIIR